MRHAVQVNSVSGLCLTKLDVLDGLETIRVCVGYKDDAGQPCAIPTGSEGYGDLALDFVDLPGWDQSTIGAKTLDALPENARAYIQFIEEKVGVPIDIISTGPDRNETIVLRHPFA